GEGGPADFRGRGRAEGGGGSPRECPSDPGARPADRRREPHWFRRNDSDCRPGSPDRRCWQLEERWLLYPCSGRSRRVLEKSRPVSCRSPHRCLSRANEGSCSAPDLLHLRKKLWRFAAVKHAVVADDAYMAVAERCRGIAPCR